MRRENNKILKEGIKKLRRESKKSKSKIKKGKQINCGGVGGVWGK